MTRLCGDAKTHNADRKEGMAEAVLSLRIDDLEPRLTRNGYDVRSLAEQFDARPRRDPPPYFPAGGE
jgi:hypothetical protein